MRHTKGVSKAAVAILSLTLISGCFAADSSSQSRGKEGGGGTSEGGENSIGIDLSDPEIDGGNASIEYDEEGEALVRTGSGSSGGSGASSTSSGSNPKSDPRGSKSTPAGKQASEGGASSSEASDSADTSHDSKGSPSSVGSLIKGHASGRCINVSGNSASSGRLLDIMDCSRGARMEWKFMPDGTIRAMGECMEVAGNSAENGANIQLAGCDGSTAQHFVLNTSHDLVNPQSHKCVDVKDQLTANTSRLQLWTCNGQRNQKWSKT
ncbi:ricin-type beta-trefoil lectin domain protein [Streptomyces sp. NPDC055210]